MHLTLRSNHAMRLLMFCAVAGDRPRPVAEIARACNMSEAHLAKIAQRLARLGLVETVRGRGGGVRLARPPAEIGVGEVVRATEAGPCIVECLSPESNTCPLTPACRFRGLIGRALEAFLATLDGHSLADLVAEPDELAALMGLPAPAPVSGPRPAAPRAAPRDPGRG